MKKVIIIIICFLFLICFLLIGYLLFFKNKPLKISNDNCSYTLPPNWEYDDSKTTKDRYTFVNEQNIIYVEMSDSRYSLDESSDFKDSIINKLDVQAELYSGTLDVKESKTKNDDIYYIFTIKSDEEDIIYYYIVGNKKYVLVFSNENNKDINKAIKNILKTFIWN